MALADPAPYTCHDLIHNSQQSSWSHSIDLETATAPERDRTDCYTLVSADAAAGMADTHMPNVGFAEGFDPVPPPQLDVSVPPGRISGDHHGWYTAEPPCSVPPTQLNSKTSPLQKKPFHRWILSLHRRASQRHSGPEEGLPHASLLAPEPIEAGHQGSFQNVPPLSASGSSLRFVSAVRSASVSLASGSAATRTRRIMARSRHLSRTDRSSRVSLSAPRVSEDSAVDQSAVVDAATTERSLQRRRILEELITTEEGYIGDVRFLINVYVTILASLPVLSASLRSSIKRNLTDVVELHEDILGELHRVVPRSEYTHFDNGAETQMPTISSANRTQDALHGHRRWRSMDAVRERISGSPLLLQELPSVYADPQVGAEVSRIFAKRMNKFFIYEEYGAKYEIMMKDIASANRTMPEWESYQRGLEALALTLGSMKCHEDASKKSLTISDLLVKPIQRVCKYPLLFAELLKYTPVCDCPNSHMEIDSALTRLREATAEINNATNDVHTRAKLEKTWVLQDRLIIPHQNLDAAARSQIRSFGRVQLCGVLHICWQTRDTVDGQYMICLLYEDVLCLAAAGKIDPVYTILASIHLGGSKLEEVDNGRGLQCHTAPFSWKLVFERDYQLYEIMMTACSPKEEIEWRSRLTPPAKNIEDWRDSSAFCSLELDIKCLGNVFGKQGTVARRLSIHRATTVGSKTPLCQVVLKNTSVVRDGAGTSTSGLAINRSQSLLMTSTRLPVLTPSRGDRARLEGLMSDVWSREILPFPGMASRTRSEHLVRASSVMRKLSVTSLTGSFGKRSGSSLQLTRHGDTWDRGEGLKLKDSLDLDGIAVTREFAEDGVTVRKLKKPKMKVTRRESLADNMAKLVVTDGPNKTAKSSQPATVKGMPQDSCELPATAGTSILGAFSVNDLRTTPREKPLSPVVVNSSKENVYSDPTTEKIQRTPSRWAKVGIARNDGKGHVFRSLFR